MAPLVHHWPLADLVVRTPRLELRWPSLEDLVALAEAAAAGVHDEGMMPFNEPWTLRPPGELERGVLQWHWKHWGSWTAEDWFWNPVTVVHGKVAGTQGMFANRFGVRRTVETGSWIGKAHQGRGIGSEMRAAVLHLAFVGLGATRAETGAFEDNRPSLGVTRRLGYRPNGDVVRDSQGVARRELRFVLGRDDWEASRRADIEIVGLEPCLPLFGAAAGANGADSEVEAGSPAG